VQPVVGCGRRVVGAQAPGVQVWVQRVRRVLHQRPHL